MPQDDMNGKDMPPVYDPHGAESRWYRHWEEKGYFHAGAGTGKPPFSMVIPPPNVTGVLHIGHALNNTLQDVMARRKRMQGFEVLWMPGTDHAGIATQNVVEKQLDREGTDRHSLGREKFVERVWQWKQEYGGTIISQLKRLGCSCDWERERFTMDEGCSLAVRTVFKQLYDQGLVYRGEYIINWCPRCHTALSDIEVEHREKSGHLWHLRYPIEGRDDFMVVATTRPETMLGDTAVAVHPSDSRYEDIVGETALLPFMDRRLPVVADAFVDPGFGTGAVKVTPAHDPNDFHLGKRHGLDAVNVLGPDGVVNQNGGSFCGMDRYRARSEIVHQLGRLGLIDKVEEHVHAVGHCYRCDTEIEPYLSTQWFVRMQELASEAIAAVRDGRTRFIPSRWEKIYFDWMEGIRDWCISRQLWWGHRIPVWYCRSCGEMTVAVETPGQCRCGSGRLEQDPDVLDTWFSSGLWPFSTMGWPEHTPELEAFYPTSVLTTAHDIIFFWVARMMMLGLKFMKEVPFRQVCVTALVRDYEGKKMSKSSGNVIDPIDVIEVYGTDALRFSLASIAVPGRDINLSEERIEGSRNFVNKIWNAARLVLVNLDDDAAREEAGDDESRELVDRWIVSRLGGLIETVDLSLEAFNFSAACKALHQFFRGDYCDWFLELAKPGFYGSDPVRARQVRRTASTVLECTLRLMHPVMPFVTEELWQRMPSTGESVMVAPWPSARSFQRDAGAEEQMAVIQSVVTGIRSARSEHSIPPAGRLSAVLVCDSKTGIILGEHGWYLESLAGLSAMEFAGSPPGGDFGIRVVAGGVEVYLAWSGGVNAAEEIDRLGRRVARVEKELERVISKLSNPAFISRAPADVVEGERKKQQELHLKREKLNCQISAVNSMRGSK